MSISQKEIRMRIKSSSDAKEVKEESSEMFNKQAPGKANLTAELIKYTQIYPNKD